MQRQLEPARLGDHLDRLYRAAWALCGSREDAEDLLRILSVWIRDVAVARVDAGALVNRDLSDLARKAAEKVSDGEVHRRHRLIEQAQYVIAERNGSARLQLEPAAGRLTNARDGAAALDTTLQVRGRILQHLGHIDRLSRDAEGGPEAALCGGGRCRAGFALGGRA